MIFVYIYFIISIIIIAGFIKKEVDKPLEAFKFSLKYEKGRFIMQIALCLVAAPLLYVFYVLSKHKKI